MVSPDPGAPGATLSLTVLDRDTIAEGVIRLVLGDPAGTALPHWEPGAHVDIVLDSVTVRQYSLCGDPRDTSRWQVAVLRDAAGRGGSRRVHDTLVPGAPVEVRGPRNHFALRAAGGYVFVAGGIGITPILPMIEQAEQAGAPWELHYGGRSPATMAFATELAARHGDRVHLRPADAYGPLDLPALLAAPRQDVLVYACGPAGLLDATASAMGAWPPGSLRVERFDPVPVPVPDPGADVEPAAAFEVELARSGATVVVPPDRSVLDVLRDAGMRVESSCGEGTCGTCETAVLDGRVDHRDAILDDDERAAHDVMFVCVSRALGPRLVLDL